MLHRMITAALLVMASIAAPAQDDGRSITRIAGDVYRFQNQFHYSIFVITDDGVVVTDPINAEAATWLAAAIKARTDRPISHLIYSHSHLDHASGGQAFGDVPLVIAHENAPPTIDGVAPDLRFREHLRLETGGKTLELTWLGPGHGEDLIAVVVRPENVAFLVDAVSVRRLPFRDFPRTDVDALIEQIRKAESLDFEIVAPGHGVTGVKADLASTRGYVEELRAAVLVALKAGRTDAEIEQSVTMADYKDWGSYDRWRALNVRGMIRHLRASGALE